MSPLLVSLSVVALLSLSAICSGLNIAILSLSPQELKRKSKLGDKNAQKIYPFRKNIHLSLASILLSNVTFGSATAVVLGDNLNGLVAVLLSTLLLVIFAELFPQAIFNKNALWFCAKFSFFLRTIVFLTYPLSKPLQLILDSFFGQDDIKNLHSRHELGLIISDHLDEPNSELDEDEVEIIRGALQLSEKQVVDIMTPISKVFWLNNNSVIDDKVIDHIKDSGYSRIPVFDKKLTECYGVILVKQLVDIDFDEKSLSFEDFKLHKTKTVGSKTALDTMFRHFIAAQTHLLPVTQNNKIVGIISIEDLIEEIIGHEIVDESDRSIGEVDRSSNAQGLN